MTTTGTPINSDAASAEDTTGYILPVVFGASAGVSAALTIGYRNDWLGPAILRAVEQLGGSYR